MPPKPVILPSLLSADFSALVRDIDAVTEAGATILHLDIMDGHFVPNISFGPGVVKAIDRISGLTLDTHLMVTDPDAMLEPFRDAGADILTVHVEACTHLHRTVSRIRELGMKAGVSLNPATPLSTVTEILPYVDLVLIMSVNPGFGGQRYIPSSTEKIRQLADDVRRRGLDLVIEVDGGIDRTTAAAASGAGAQYLVAGNAVFGAGDIRSNFTTLQKLITT